MNEHILAPFYSYREAIVSAMTAALPKYSEELSNLSLKSKRLNIKAHKHFVAMNRTKNKKNKRKHKQILYALRDEAKRGEFQLTLLGVCDVNQNDKY